MLVFRDLIAKDLNFMNSLEGCSYVLILDDITASTG